MQPLCTIAQMRDAEAQLIASGISSAQLIARAGAAVAHHIMVEYSAPAQVLVCAGPGNNGADGIAVACILAQHGYHVSLAIWRRHPDAWLDRARALHIPVDEALTPDTLALTISRMQLVVDALLGIGANRPLSDDVAGWVAAINARPAHIPCVAIDVPTGCLGDGADAPALMVHADTTYATGPRKLSTCFMPGLVAAGRVITLDIGLVTEAFNCFEATAESVAHWLPARPIDAYKGTFGTLCVWAGSAAFPGAAVLATHAALRAGSGIVSIATSSTLVPLLWRFPELTITTLDAQPLNALSDARFSAFVVGPGLGRAPDTDALLTSFIGQQHLATRPVVLDADALTLLSRHPRWYAMLPAQQMVLTPHIGELTRLCGGVLPADAPCARAQLLAMQWQQVVVMKGSTTVIAAPDGQCVVWPHPNPLLAVGGSGDVLAGIIGALLAQGVTPFRAAVLGVVIHGMAAAHLRRTGVETGVLPSDLIAHIPATIAMLRKLKGDTHDAHL
ncbi:MAG: NAD(P)H-hydrate dehydratase [Roseiflexaceae bacterium]